MRQIYSTWAKAAAVSAAFVLCFSLPFNAQTKRPAPKKATPKTVPLSTLKVTLVDEASLKKLLVPNGKPLLVNFWATWCDPCREEFPDLVKIDQQYKGKIDFITVSLDDVENISTTVPKFLTAMKAEMTPYLLRASDENTFIASIAKDWQGGMPFTALYTSSGELAYYREGKLVIGTLQSELIKVVGAPSGGQR
ncbi:MAG: TlpA family protein disulfide reductase [Pyrinomonadaceae bacterium]